MQRHRIAPIVNKMMRETVDRVECGLPDSTHIPSLLTLPSPSPFSSSFSLRSVPPSHEFTSVNGTPERRKLYDRHDWTRHVYRMHPSVQQAHAQCRPTVPIDTTDSTMGFEMVCDQLRSLGFTSTLAALLYEHHGSTALSSSSSSSTTTATPESVVDGGGVYPFDVDPSTLDLTSVAVNRGPCPEGLTPSEWLARAILGYPDPRPRACLLLLWSRCCPPHRLVAARTKFPNLAKDIPYVETPLPNLDMSAYHHTSKHFFSMYGKDGFQLWQIPAKLLALELSRLTCLHFLAVTPSDLIGTPWASYKTRFKSANLLRLTTLFNSVSLWLSSLLGRALLASPTAATANTIFEYMRSLMDTLVDMNDLHTLFCVYSSVSNNHIRKYVPLRITDSDPWRQIVDLMSNSENYKRLRSRIKSAIQEARFCIPYVGLAQTDLTFMEDGNPDTLGEGDDVSKKKINVEKMEMVGGVVYDVQVLKGRCAEAFEKVYRHGDARVREVVKRRPDCCATYEELGGMMRLVPEEKIVSLV